MRKIIATNSLTMQNLNSTNIVESFINQHRCENKIAERIAIYESVRDFLYQINGVNNPEKLLERREGYCAVKHRLLKMVYDQLGYKTQLCFVPFSFDMVYLPDFLKNWGYANKKGYHVFLNVNIDGQWVYIDATFNSELKTYYVVNENRDGISSQNIICDYDKIYVPKSSEEEWEIKKKLSDPRGITAGDNVWLEKYNDWIKSLKK